MSVFTRLSDIINANVNAILETAEDPEKMVRMITQEMQETLVELRSASARYIADRKQVRQKIDAHERQASQWQEKAELAITRGRDDLAKGALREKSRHEESVTHLKADLDAIEGAIGKFQHDAAQLEEKLKHARARQKALIVRGKTAKQRIKVKRQIHDVNYDEAFEKFEAYERKLDEMEGEIESYDLASQSLSDEIDSLAADEALDAEVARLKSRLSANHATA